jgi:transcriptional regulator with XRE-family HTH domain
MSEQTSEEDIGKRLRALRISRKLSQRELMRRTGVSNATISMIETGSVSPTISMLKKILAGFPIGLAEFFGSDVAQLEEPVFFGKGDLLVLSRGGVEYLQVCRNLEGKAIQMLYERYEPGATTGKHPLRHQGEECGFILSGALRVTVHGRTRVLRAGEAYYFRSDQDHMFRNDGNEPCTLVSACTPPSI